MTHLGENMQILFHYNVCPYKLPRTVDMLALMYVVDKGF